MRYILSIFLIIFLNSCAYKNKQILDTKEYSQDPSTYLKNLDLPKLKKTLKEEFKEKYFQIWDLKKFSFTKKQATWGNYYSKKKIYLENHRLASKEWFAKQMNNSNFEKYNTVLKKALLIKNSDFKVFPSSSKMFFNPKEAGEGFPFDYNQNSRVKINTPLLISHYSKDKAWAFVQSNFVLGWVRIDNLLLIDEKSEKEFRNKPLYVIIKEGFEIFETTSSEDLKVGTFFPKEDDKYLLATKDGLKKIYIDKKRIEKFPLKFTKDNISKLAKEFIGEPYGWGGLNNHRDCSSFTQDFFSAFGIYLKRNSKGQTQLHKYIDLSKMNNKKKKEFIKNNAIPFLTLVYLKGHIMLYIGKKNNEALVMHNLWGVRTWDFPFKKGRNIIGKTVITTLEPGIELNNVNKNKTILNNIQGIVLLNQEK